MSPDNEDDMSVGPLIRFMTYGRLPSRGARPGMGKYTELLYKTVMVVSSVYDDMIDKSALSEVIDMTRGHLERDYPSFHRKRYGCYCKLLYALLSHGFIDSGDEDVKRYGKVIAGPNRSGVELYFPFYLLFEAMLERKSVDRKRGQSLFPPEPVPPKPVPCRKLDVGYGQLTNYRNRGADITRLYSPEELREVMLRVRDSDGYLCHGDCGYEHVDGSRDRRLAYFMDYAENHPSYDDCGNRHSGADLNERLTASLNLSDSIESHEIYEGDIRYYVNIDPCRKTVVNHMVYIIGLHRCLVHNPSINLRVTDVGSVDCPETRGRITIRQFPVDRIDERDWGRFLDERRPAGVVFGLLSDECEDFIIKITGNPNVPCIRVGEGEGRLHFNDIDQLTRSVRDWYVSSMGRENVAVR